MELFKAKRKVVLSNQADNWLETFDYRAIAFVVGISHHGMHSLCVTKAGQYLFSRKDPAQLCGELERGWQIYQWPTHLQTQAAWQRLKQQDAQSAPVSLGMFQGPLRVATNGQVSFWSPNPGNPLGLWFVTPVCQAITIHGDHVDFSTTYRGHVTHWSAQKADHSPLPVTQARVDKLLDFVLRKMAITQGYAAQLLGQIAYDQGLTLPQYPYQPLAPQFPLSKRFAHVDTVESVATFFLGRSYEEWAPFVAALNKILEEKDDKQH